jgi:hypothetical protein
MSGSWSIPGIRVIDLDATELPSNDREIFEAVVERVFADPAVLEAEVPGATAPVAAAFDDAGASSSVAFVPDVDVSEQPALGQSGDVGHPALSASSEAEEGFLGEPAVSAELAVIAPPLQTAGAMVGAPPPLMEGATEGVAEVAEPSFVQPAVAVEVALPR